MKSTLQKHGILRERKDGFSFGVSSKNWGINTDMESLNNVTLSKSMTREERDALLRRLSDSNESHED